MQYAPLHIVCILHDMYVPGTHKQPEINDGFPKQSYVT